MSELVRSVRVTPYFRQVVVEAEDPTDLPVPRTGTEAVVATAESVLVATRAVEDGDVTIEVHRGGTPAHPGARVFDGELSLAAPRLVVGCYHADQLVSVDIDRAGQLPVTIYVDPPGAPERVVVVIP